MVKLRKNASIARRVCRQLFVTGLACNLYIVTRSAFKQMKNMPSGLSI